LPWLANSSDNPLNDNEIGWIDFSRAYIDKLTIPKDKISRFFAPRYTNPACAAHESIPPPDP
jgi:hypothetical protein